MKDKRQKMTLTWPCGDPVLAAYVLQQAAAATGMQLGPAPGGYPGGLFAAAAAAAAAASSSPFGPIMAPRPPGLPPPPPPPFVSPISSASNIPHRPTPNLLTPHLHSHHHPQHTPFLPTGGGLSPHSPPIDGGVMVGSAFSPATPPASCDSSSNLNLGQVSPQTTTKTEQQISPLKKEGSCDFIGGERRGLESRQERAKDNSSGSAEKDYEERKQAVNSLRSINATKRKRECSSGSTSSSSSSHSPSVSPTNPSIFSNNKQLKNISSLSSSRLQCKTNSASSLEVLGGLYVVKSQQNNKNTITGKDAESLSPNRSEDETDKFSSTKSKTFNNCNYEDNDARSDKGERDPICREAKFTSKVKSSNTTNCPGVSPSSTGTTAPASSSSLFQPYLDVEKKQC